MFLKSNSESTSTLDVLGHVLSYVVSPVTLGFLVTMMPGVMLEPVSGRLMFCLTNVSLEVGLKQHKYTFLNHVKKVSKEEN